MFNLLPDNLQEKIKVEYRLRRFIVILLSVLFLQISFLIFLFPSWIISQSREKEIALQVENLNQSPLFKDINPVASIIKSTNIKLNIINKGLEYPAITLFVNFILSNKIPEIHVNEILYTSTSASTATISIGGISGTREALVSFVKGLQKSGVFKAVDLPVSNLAKDKNINFSINVIISS